jgi:hypothetical protein
VADSKRLQILKALTAHLEGIQHINGYQNDLDGRVYRGRAVFGAETPLPCVTIVEALNPDRNPLEAGDGLAQKDFWILLIQGWAESGSDEHPTDEAHNLMADVKKALGKIMDSGSPHNPNPSYMLGGIIEGFRTEPGTVRPPDENSARSYFYLRAVVEVVETLEDPFAAAF